jgi:hypothetical protein
LQQTAEAALEILPTVRLACLTCLAVCLAVTIVAYWCSRNGTGSAGTAPQPVRVPELKSATGRVHFAHIDGLEQPADRPEEPRPPQPTITPALLSQATG